MGRNGPGSGACHDERVQGRRVPGWVLGLAGLGTVIYRLVVRGALTLDTGIGRRTRPLGPIHLDMAAPPETVFDIIAAPYLGKTPKAMEDKLHVLERGSDMVLAEHFTEVCVTTTTVETVRFERPSRIYFRLVRGPVPYVTETFDLEPSDVGTAFTYTGEMGADFWALGEWWANKVAARWDAAVAASLSSIKAEAERLAAKSPKSTKPSGRSTSATPRTRSWRTVIDPDARRRPSVD